MLSGATSEIRDVDGVPEGLLGEIVVLDDVGPIRWERAHPVAHAVVGPLLIAAAVLVGGLVLLPVVRVVIDAVTGEGGFFRSSSTTGSVWDLHDLGTVWLRTLIWAVIVPALVTVVGVALAFRLHHRPGRVLGAALVAPTAVPLVVTGVTFRLLYHPDPDRGAATYLLGFVPGSAGWLGREAITTSLILAFVWVWLGLTTLVFRAALDRVPVALADIPRISGRKRWGIASVAIFHDAYWQPVLRRVVGVMFVLVAVMSARTLDLILVMTPGSVLEDARVLSVMHYQQAVSAPAGTSAALGTLWLLATAAVLAVAVWTWPAWPMPDRSAAEDESRAERVRRPVFHPVVAGVWLAPLVVLVGTALHDPRRAAISGWWSRPLGLGSFDELGSFRFFDSLRLTAIVTVIVCVVAVVVAALAVEALERLSVRAVRMTLVVMVAAAVVPVQVIADPVNDVFDAIEAATPLGLPGQVRLTLVHVALAVPLCIVVLVAGRARAYDRARRVWDQTAERPGPLRRLRRSATAARRYLSSLDEEPAAIAALVLVFLQVWNDFVVGLFFSGRDAAPVELALYGQTRQFVANSGPLAAGSVLALAVPLVVLVATHQHLIDGLIGTHAGPVDDKGDTTS